MKVPEKEWQEFGPRTQAGKRFYPSAAVTVLVGYLLGTVLTLDNQHNTTGDNCFSPDIIMHMSAEEAPQALTR
jgi:hypothetical protein